MFPWGNERRFNAYSRYCKAHFGGRVQRLPVDAGFSCPNRLDRSHGGCTYCANNAFSPSYLDKEDDVAAQLERGKAFFHKRYPHNQGYLAYFQAYTNTYASLPLLREKFESALQVPEIRGLVISTRPDCLPEVSATRRWAISIGDIPWSRLSRPSANCRSERFQFAYI